MAFRGPVAKSGKLETLGTRFGIHTVNPHPLNKNVSLTVHQIQKIILLGFLGGAGERRNRNRGGHEGDQQGTEHGFEMQGIQFVVTTTGVPTLTRLKT